MRTEFLSKLGLLVAALVAIAASPMASAQISAVLYDSGGFESPRFAPGPLEGQDPPPNGPWLSDVLTSSGDVTLNNPLGGLQAVKVTRAASSSGDSRWAVSKPYIPTLTANAVDIDVDMRVDQATFSGVPPTNTDFGPAFGLEAYDGFTLIGSVSVDATSGAVLYQQAVTGFLTETGTTVARGGYHHYKLRVLFGTNQYQAFVDNVLVRTESFVEAGAVKFTDAPITTFAVSASGVTTATGTAYFDNYSIAATPEPGGFALVSAGIAMLSVRRRRSTVMAA